MLQIKGTGTANQSYLFFLYRRDCWESEKIVTIVAGQDREVGHPIAGLDPRYCNTGYTFDKPLTPETPSIKKCVATTLRAYGQSRRAQSKTRFLRFACTNVEQNSISNQRNFRAKYLQNDWGN